MQFTRTKGDTTRTRKLVAAGFAACAGIAASALPAHAEEPSPDATCHGKPATYLGTGGEDVIDDETNGLGRNPVIVLGQGADELRVGLSYRSIDRLTVCAGPGADSERGSDVLLGGRGFDPLDGDIRSFPDGEDFANGGAARDRCEADVQRDCES